jgi:hypothetical protein
MRTLLATLCFFALSAVGLKAEVNVKEYRAIVASNDKARLTELKVYIRGLGEGVAWANTFLETSKKPLLFCPPAKLFLGTQNYIDIIEAQIRDRVNTFQKDELDEQEIGMLLVFGLMDTFPCNSK